MWSIGVEAVLVDSFSADWSVMRWVVQQGVPVTQTVADWRLHEGFSGVDRKKWSDVSNVIQGEASGFGQCLDMWAHGKGGVG